MNQERIGQFRLADHRLTHGFMVGFLIWLAAIEIACELATTASAAETARFKVAQSMEIDEVCSSFPVGFSLLTGGGRQYVAYYDSDRHMTVASRQLDANTWNQETLPSRIGWDSHNYITMALDRRGQLHLSGNMHNVPLIYFRTEIPGDISTLSRRTMTGIEEDRVTYPRFLTDRNGALIFNYRNGGSGNGMRIYNKYDVETRAWSRLLDTPLLDGEGKRNAYPLGPIRGPDGWFHMVWVWRDTPDCATNHHLSHARSRDLLRWETANGKSIELPITLGNNEVWVDPIPAHGGIINGCEKLTFDSNERPIISYHKEDAEGNMQIYAARAEVEGWKQYRLTDWKKPVKFGGNGSMGFIGIHIGTLTRVESGVLSITWRHRDYGSGRLFIDESTLSPIDRRIEMTPEFPTELRRVQSDFPGMQIRRAKDSGDSGDDGVRFVLQWEALGANHDRPRQPPLPPPSTLYLHKLVAVVPESN